MTPDLVDRHVSGRPSHRSVLQRWSVCLRPVLAAVLGLTLLSSARAQGAGSISGRVANADTGSYLENAEVRVAGTDLVTLSTSGGRYVISNVPAGEATVTVTYTGLEPATEKVTVTSGSTAAIDFNLSSQSSKDVVRLGAFVVAGTREGNARAITEQRRSVNIKNVISADAFGSVAEDNLGEFLKYMPGLSINYNENDARTVSVRGMPSKYSSVTIDGLPVASADFSIGTGREFQFEQVSLSTIGTVEVNKTPLADQSASGLAGSVNVRSKSAFDQKGRRITYSANFTTNSYATDLLTRTPGWDNEKHFKTLPGGSFSFSDTFMDGRLGVVAAVSHTGTYVDQKIIAALGRVFDNDPTNNATEIPKINTVNWQDGPKPTYRDAVLINLDYKLTPEIQLSLRTSYNAYNAPFHNRNWTWGANTATMTNLTADSVTTTAASTGDTANSITVAGTNFRKYGATFNINPALTWKINDNVTLDAAAGYSRSYQWYDSDAEGFFNIVSARMTGVSWGYTAKPGSTALQMTQLKTAASTTGSIFDIANYNNNNTATAASRDAKDQRWAGRADITIKLPQLSMPTTLKFGVESHLLVKNMDTWTKVWSMNANPATGGINLSQYSDPISQLTFHKGETFTDLNGRVGTAPNLDKWKLYDLFQTYNTDPFTVTTAAQQPFFLTTAQAAANLRNKLTSRSDFEETIHAAYLMGNITPMKKLLISGGLRFESTDSKGRGVDDLGDAKTRQLTGGITDTNNFTYIQTRFGQRSLKKQSYDNLFPSLQGRYSLTNNLSVRAAYFRSILRPDPANIARGLTVNDDQTQFTEANPDLKPEFADNFDVRVEYYFEPVGVLSAGVFMKNLHDTQVGLISFFTADNVPPSITQLGYDPATLVANNATFNRTVNGPDSTVSGLELEYSQQLSFLPGAWSGFGVFANYTYTHPDDMVLFALATAGSAVSSGIPKHAINGGINYKAGRFSGGIKINYLGERLLGAPGYTIDVKNQKAVPYSVNAITGAQTAIANAGILTYEKARMQVDVSLQYELARWATVFLNVANINDSRSIRYSDRAAFINRDGGYGAKYTFGVKGTF